MQVVTWSLKASRWTVRPDFLWSGPEFSGILRGRTIKGNNLGFEGDERVQTEGKGGVVVGPPTIR